MTYSAFSVSEKKIADSETMCIQSCIAGNFYLVYMFPDMSICRTALPNTAGTLKHGGAHTDLHSYPRTAGATFDSPIYPRCWTTDTDYKSLQIRKKNQKKRDL